MKLARFFAIFLTVLFAMTAVVSAYTYYGVNSVYYGSGYRPYYNYHYYGPAIYYGPHYYQMQYMPSYTYYRYYPVNYYYYQPRYYQPSYTYRPYGPTYWWGW